MRTFAICTEAVEHLVLREFADEPLLQGPEAYAQVDARAECYCLLVVK